MKVKDLILHLVDMCDLEAKVYVNNKGYSEVEIRLFLLNDAPTVREYIERLLDISLYATVLQDYSITYHYHHFKRYRFYEITPLQK